LEILGKKKHPYEYVTLENFETVKGVMTMGMSSGRTPKEIATQLSAATNIPFPACYALVQQEFLGSLKELEKKE